MLSVNSYGYFNRIIYTYIINIIIMSKKTFAIVSGIVGAVQTASVAIITSFDVPHATEINSAIVVVGTCIIEICTIFAKTDSELEKAQCE